MYFGKNCLTDGDGGQPVKSSKDHDWKKRVKQLSGFLALTALSWHAAHAGEVTTQFSGYGTLGVVKTNSEDADLTRTPIQYRGASDKNWDYGVDSRLGLQGTVGYEQFSVTGQLLTQRLANSDIRPRVEWFFANYAPTDWLDLRVGRMVLPLFVLSDSRNAGFASVWLRAPQEVYSLYPITGVDGIQAIARIPIGDSILTVQPSYGSTSGAYSLSFLGSTIGIDYKNLASILVNWEYGNWMLHFGRSKTNITTRLGTIPGFIDPPGPAAFTLDSVFQKDGGGNEYMANFGFIYDNGQAVVQAEYVRRTQDPGGYENAGYYAMLGWRFGKMTPYYVYGRYDPLDEGPQHTAGLIQGNSNTVGIRYDISKTSAIKVQFERRDPVNLFINNLPLTNPSPFETNIPNFNYELGAKKINAISIAYDFVF